MQNMINDYYQWMNYYSGIQEKDFGYELTLPYLDHQDDCIRVYIRNISPDEIKIDDDGYILRSLFANGRRFDPKGWKVFEILKKDANIQIIDDIFQIQGKKEDFAWLLHTFLRCILSIDLMIYFH